MNTSQYGFMGSNFPPRPMRARTSSDAACSCFVCNTVRYFVSLITPSLKIYNHAFHLPATLETNCGAGLILVDTTEPLQSHSVDFPNHRRLEVEDHHVAFEPLTGLYEQQWRAHCEQQIIILSSRNSDVALRGKYHKIPATRPLLRAFCGFS